MERRLKLWDSNYRSERRGSMILACLLFWSILSYLLISRYVVQSTQVVGASMVPTLLPGQMCLIHRWALLFKPPARGEVVAIRLPDDTVPVVKRVIALPGDTIQVKNGHVFVNQVRLDEPYLSRNRVTPARNLAGSTYVVERGSYFVLGDNRNNSQDSRHYGAVPGKCILGKVTAFPSLPLRSGRASDTVAARSR